ncbi:hypothetical protein BV210_04315 [Halorientalis sp. IM1011]|uniref:DUF7284 family protein n=1 Tax=Halorientalis sp. IM1011 TaxID=1932360 RepID=UPI00097CC592|nr:hypothetical protein [Halorientalis sp. IM1011]AQL41989.1 hypothetical protein BV210_04315 [Halorientalis sp. IM1011]
MRAISTVLDAALFLLLVGAAVGTLALGTSPPPSANADAADGVADALTTSTATVQYSLAPGARRASSRVVTFPITEGATFRRTAHGTLASHLSTAALGSLAVDGQRVSHARVDYQRSVANATRNLTRGRDHLARIRARWEPYPDAPIRGTYTVGPAPPRDATVHAETVVVASGLPSTREAARRVTSENATNATFERLGSIVAQRVVRGLFPPNRTRSALLGDYPVEQLVTYRYERLGRFLGANVTARAEADNATGANDALAAALGDRLAADMRTRFQSPSAAADAVSVGQVRITVRTWSP